VSVELLAGTGEAEQHAVPDPATVLELSVDLARARTALRATAGPAEPGGRTVLDEHFVVGADGGHEARWLDLADVLYASRPRTQEAAVAWLRTVAARHGSCRIAVAPLHGGGSAVLDPEKGHVAVLPVAAPGRQWLLASCLLGWLTAGGTLQELSGARLTCR
jgi:hypothetical protein